MVETDMIRRYILKFSALSNQQCGKYSKLSIFRKQNPVSLSVSHVSRDICFLSPGDMKQIFQEVEMKRNLVINFSQEQSPWQ